MSFSNCDRYLIDSGEVCKTVTVENICLSKHFLSDKAPTEIYILRKEVIDLVLSDENLIDRLAEDLWNCLERLINSKTDTDKSLFTFYIVYSKDSDNKILLLEYFDKTISRSEDVKLFLKKIHLHRLSKNKDLSKDLIFIVLPYSILIHGVAYSYNLITLERDHMIIEIIDKGYSSKVLISKKTRSVFEYYLDSSHIDMLGSVESILRVAEMIADLIHRVESILRKDVYMFWLVDRSFNIYVYMILYF
ncbi:MAG: hypothetical protein ABWJ42_00385 [Sulfolobales archaeon]